VPSRPYNNNHNNNKRTKKKNQNKVRTKAKLKNDLKAVEFSKWYSTKFIEEHNNPYPAFMNKVYDYKDRFEKLPEIKVMIRASDRYKDDINQQIKVNLNHGKLRSKEELDIEIKRQLPIFLEIINHKRSKKKEPKIDKNQINVSAFLDIENHTDVEIAYISEIYIHVVKRLVDESRRKIKELTAWQ